MTNRDALDLLNRLLSFGYVTNMDITDEVVEALKLSTLALSEKVREER